MSAAQASTGSIKGKHLPASAHGGFEELFDGVWFVRGGIKLPMPIPMKIGRSMTVVRGDDGLTVFNSMRLSEAGFAELDSLGEVKNVVRLAAFHGRDDGVYRERYGAKIYAIKGQRYVRGMKPADASAQPFMEPDEWLTEDSPLPIADAKLRVIASCNPPEGMCLLQRHGGILISGDALQHTPEPDEFYNWFAKFMMKRMGFIKPHNVGPGWLNAAKPTPDDVRSLLDLEFEHVLPVHGTAVIGDARSKYRPAIERATP